MSMFDRIRGMGRKKKEETSISSEESFDLDDDALFGTDEVGGDDAFATVGDVGGEEGLDTFGTLADEGDLGAAGTQDFEGGFDDDFGGDFGGEGLGDDFGDEAALDVGDDAADAPTGKKKKRQKAKRAKAPGQRGRGKVLVVTLGAAVVGVVIGVFATPAIMDTVSGKSALRAKLVTTNATLAELNTKLAPLKRAASPDEVQVMQAEWATRQEQGQEIDAITVKVADQPDRETERDLAIKRRDAAAAALAVRQASLGNVAKQSQQLERRVAYLTDTGAEFMKTTQAYDAHVRGLQQSLPEPYTAAATAEARHTLSVQARVEFGASQ